MDPPEPQNRKLVWVIGGALLVLGIAIGLELLPRRSGEPQGPPPRRRLPFQDPRLQQERVDVLGETAGKTLTYEQLIALLKSKASDPLAQSFAREFLEDGALKDIWEAYDRTHDLEAFAKTLKSSGAFTRLLQKYETIPGFQELAEDIARQAPLARFVAGPKAKREGPAVGPKTQVTQAKELKGRSPSGSPERPSEEFKYFTDPALAGLGFYLNDPRVVGIGYGLDAREQALLRKALEGRGEGESSWDACERAGLLPECTRMVQSCMSIPGCVALTNPSTPTSTTAPTTTNGTTTPTTIPPTTTTDPCANAECPRDCSFWPAACAPPCPCPTPPTCGRDADNDGNPCDFGDTCSNCRDDCCPCGDNICTTTGRTPPENSTNCPQDCNPPPSDTNLCFCNRAPQGYCGGLGNCAPDEWGYREMSAPYGACLTNNPTSGCQCPSDCTGQGPWVCQPAASCTTTTTAPPCVPDGSCDAPDPACGETTDGADNCGNSCQKTGPACCTCGPWYDLGCGGNCMEQDRTCDPPECRTEYRCRPSSQCREF